MFPAGPARAGARTLGSRATNLVPLGLALVALAVTPVWSQEAPPSPGESPVLAWFDFEGEAVETGPYTLIAFEDARGSVRLTTRYRLSGFRSVEIRDVAGDGEFAELQGFFREMAGGKLYVHFAVLIALPQEGLNIALAGDAHFRLEKHGIGFWLTAHDGTLFHVTEGREEPLFPRATVAGRLPDRTRLYSAHSVCLSVVSRPRRPTCSVA